MQKLAIAVAFAAVAALGVPSLASAGKGQPGAGVASPTRQTGQYDASPQEAWKATSPGAGVASPSVAAGEAGQLDAAQQDLAWKANQSKGVRRLQILDEQQRIDGLIRDIESGRSVDPAAVDAALKAN